MEQSLSQDEFLAALDQWQGCEVAVRVVSETDNLVTVFCGLLGRRSDEKQPALFWPVATSRHDRHAEKPGIYLHPDRFQSALVHEGGWVLELRQDAVTLNLRRV